jgi:hypothetical protein
MRFSEVLKLLKDIFGKILGFGHFERVLQIFSYFVGFLYTDLGF